MDLTSILQTVVGAGIGSALIQVAVPFARDWKKRSAQASYLALRLAVILEAFAAASCDLIAANESASHLPDQRYPNWRTKLPALAEFPSDPEGWLALDRRLAERALTFPNRVSESQGIIDETQFYNDGGTGGAVEAEAMERGLEAWRLASALRLKHKATAASPVWDYPAKLEAIERRYLDYAREREGQARRPEA